MQIALPLPQHTTTMENLPNEVLSDIFVRLLAKQLALMRCICKSWNALLSDSSFIKSHLHRSIHHNDEIFLFFQPDFSFDCNSFTARPSHSPNLELTNFIKLPVNPQPKYTYGSVIGSENGLICFYYVSHYVHFREYVVYIWNPSLSVFLTLPPCPLPSSDLTRNHFRFGYEPKTDDYKVVKLTSLSKPFIMLPEVEVYSMRKGSWDLISQDFLLHVTWIIDFDEVCVDGHDGRLHWLGYIDEEMKVQKIVAFDLGAETFHEIPLPGSIRHHNEYVLLGVLARKLCTISRARDDECEVWVMDEYGVAESWVKHHAFPQFSGKIRPYGFTLHNEFLFEEKDGSFGLYDLVAAKAKTFKITDRQLGKAKVVGYVDSLVWVAPTHHSLDEHLSRFQV